MLAESLLTIIGLASAQMAGLPPQQMANVPFWNQLPTSKYVDTVTAHAPVKKNPEDFGVQTNAKAAVVMDVSSGAVLFESDAQEAYPIASLTKLMTAMVFLDQKPDLNQEVTITPDDNPEAVSLYAPSETLSESDALKALLIPSSNEAAGALARVSLGKDAFVKRMNQKAIDLGLSHASFVEPSGFDSNNHASAKDVALMMRAAMNYPDIMSIANQDHVTIKGKTGRSYTLKTTNLLLASFLNKGPYKVVAAKTGTLPEAGYCFAQATQNQDNHMIITVVLGSDTHLDRFQDVKALTYWAFQSYDWPKSDAMAPTDKVLAAK